MTFFSGTIFFVCRAIVNGLNGRLLFWSSVMQWGMFSIGPAGKFGMVYIKRLLSFA